MATVFKRKGSDFYYARFQIEGKDFALSTKKKKRREAMAVMRELIRERKETLSIDDTFELLISEMKKIEKAADSYPQIAELYRKREEFAHRILHEQRERLPLADAWERWLSTQDRPDVVILNECQDIWQIFLTWADETDIEFLHELTASKAGNYAAYLLEIKVDTSIYNAHLIFLKGLFDILKTEAGLFENPWEDISAIILEHEKEKMLSGHYILGKLLDEYHLRDRGTVHKFIDYLNRK